MNNGRSAKAQAYNSCNLIVIIRLVALNCSELLVPKGEEAPAYVGNQR
jgi:hypothetical protein